jgi:hypothetical protein
MLRGTPQVFSDYRGTAVHVHQGGAPIRYRVRITGAAVAANRGGGEKVVGLNTAECGIEIKRQWCSNTGGRGVGGASSGGLKERRQQIIL